MCTYEIDDPMEQIGFYSIMFYSYEGSDTTQEMKFRIKDFFSKCDQIRRKL